MAIQFKRVAVTNQAFTQGAVAHAVENKVQVVTRTSLEELLGRHPTTNHELDAALQEWLLV